MSKDILPQCPIVKMIFFGLDFEILQYFSLDQFYILTVQTKNINANRDTSLVIIFLKQCDFYMERNDGKFEIPLPIT